MNETILMMMLQGIIAVFMAVGLVGVHKKRKRLEQEENGK